MNKILRYAFVAAMTAISSFTFAQSKTVTISSAELQAPDKKTLTLSKDGITVTISNGRMDYKYSYRIYQKASMTISSEKDNMLKINLECDAYKEKDGKAYLADGLEATEGFTISDDNVNATWEGDAKSVSIKAAIKQVRVKTITVTLKDSETTGIENVATESVNENAPMYNLAGQRVAKNYKGVVIQNGKKFINK